MSDEEVTDEEYTDEQELDELDFRNNNPLVAGGGDQPLGPNEANEQVARYGEGIQVQDELLDDDEVVDDEE